LTTANHFPRRMFRWAALYGVVVLLPMYLAPLPQRGAEVLLGFIGLALVFQGVFWVIGSDPAKYRALMPLAVAEKLVFAVPALALFAQGRVEAPLAAFAGIDLLLGLGFWLARRRTLLTP
jgi:LPXTG-motif cell wall-anchored protein